jgi:hypothetical protein
VEDYKQPEPKQKKPCKKQLNNRKRVKTTEVLSLLLASKIVEAQKKCTVKKSEFNFHKPSVNERLFFLLSGAILSVPLTLFINQYATTLLSGLSTFYASAISIAVFAPLIEEFSKAYPLFYRHGETQRSIFGLALFVGLGFGVVEFITYIFALGVSPIQRIPGLFFPPRQHGYNRVRDSNKKTGTVLSGCCGASFCQQLFCHLGRFSGTQCFGCHSNGLLSLPVIWKK